MPIQRREHVLDHAESTGPTLHDELDHTGPALDDLSALETCTGAMYHEVGIDFPLEVCESFQNRHFRYDVLPILGFKRKNRHGNSS